MKFNPSKCKSLIYMVYYGKYIVNASFEWLQFHYSMDRELIDYCESKKDFKGIKRNGSLNFNFHSNIFYSKANQRIGC